MRYLVTAPWWLRLSFSRHCIWEIPDSEKSIFITFDDGPHPTITPWVLDLLKQYDAKATFFCIGNNVKLYPKIYQRILEEGHRVGNHTYGHLNSKLVDEKTWLGDVKKAAQQIDTDIFRPPYGRITRNQERKLREDTPSYRTIMWSVLSGDFDSRLKGEDCYDIVRKNVRSGGIIVFHDSEKAKPRLMDSLPRVLDFLKKEQFSFKKIP